MRTTLALLVSLALATAGESAAQDEGGLLNERSKTESAHGPAVATPVPPDLLDLATRAAKLADTGGDQVPEARRLMGNLRADARFDALPREFRFAVLGVAGYVEMDDGQPEAARLLFRQALELQDTDPDLWHWLSWVESQLDRHDDAALSLARLFQQAPDRMDNIQDNHIWRLVHEPGVSPAARTELLQAIFDSGWKREPLGGASGLHYELALIRAGQGDIAALRRIVPTVTWPGDIVRMRSDKRFDAVVDPDEPAFDPLTAAARLVKSLQAQVRRAPDRLDILTHLQSALLVVGRFEEVITLAEDVQSAIESAPAHKPPYSDMDKLAWVQNQHARALEGLGRFDMSLARLEAASRLEESGRPNVSQALNLAQMYASLDRPDEALAASARAGSDMSDIGRMVKASAEQRAYLRKGDVVAAAKALDFLRENRATSETIYLDALVEAGDLDTAAAVLTAQLESADDRAEVLYKLQDFKDLPTPPAYAAVLANWKVLIARPDVQAAVARVGRISKVDLYHME